MFYGIYERKVSTMALCKLFEHGVTTNDARLVAVRIRDVVETVQNGDRPRTRQQSGNAQQQWVDVPGNNQKKTRMKEAVSRDQIFIISFFTFSF